MTYCFAWKSDGEIYIVADSLTSAKSEAAFEREATLSSVGELYGEYNSYFIAETNTKIYVKNNIVVAYAGKDTKIFEDVKNNLDLMIDHLTPEQIISYLPEILVESELILGVKNENNKLYHLNNYGFKEIDGYIAIGSGSKIPDLNNLMQDFTVTYPDPSYEPRKKLTAATAYLQMISIKNNFLGYFVGGTFCGVCIHKEIEWNDDLLYFFYDEKFENKKLINFIIRKNSIITGSDFTGLTKLFQYEEMDEIEFRKMSRYIHKCISSYIPRYVVFYSFEFNNIYFCDIYKYTHTALMRIFQRRGKVSRTELFTSPFLLENFLLKNKNDEKFIIPFNYLDTSPVPYVPRDQLIENVENIWDVDFGYENFDYPLESIELPIEISDVFKSQIEEYENIIIVNFEYLESKILELKNFYNGLNVSFDSLKILTGICKRIEKDFEIDNIKILLFSKRYEFFYNRMANLEMYLNQADCSYKLFTETLLLNYYQDDRYYHLNKIFIIDDSPHLNDLFEIFPDYNRYQDEADIFMVKNQNRESQVLYSPYYYNADILISKIAGLSDEALGWWDPVGTPQEELEKIAEYLNFQIENSIF
ncbi:hypothetical protein [Bacillus badius]|uniref:Uncharacterized protein n=1 Tax=Bacillus badius TaxID=1455 RepID=A0ABR5AP65_BACBA|nr:hypothetical protein [Bacillus badius]KIL74124.1 hypothetical protein SD77_2980 [Bacillus badius]MED4717335.1 hypothetical protein [Bacillus badius]